MMNIFNLIYLDLCLTYLHDYIYVWSGMPVQRPIFPSLANSILLALRARERKKILQDPASYSHWMTGANTALPVLLVLTQWVPSCFMLCVWLFYISQSLLCIAQSECRQWCKVHCWAVKGRNMHDAIALLSIERMRFTAW